MHDRLENLLDPDAHLRAAVDRFLGGNGENFLELPVHRGNVGVRQIDLVDHRDDGEALLVREMHVGDRLRLDALRRVDDEERAFAGRETDARLRRQNRRGPGVSSRLSRYSCPSCAV